MTWTTPSASPSTGGTDHHLTLGLGSAPYARVATFPAMGHVEDRRHDRGVWALLVLIAVVGSWAAASTFGVNPSHTGGGDAANYANAGEQYASARPAGRDFLPPEIQPPDGELIDDELFGALVRPGGESPRTGVMTSFVFVSQNGTVRYPHAHLSPRVSGLVERVVGLSAVPFLSFGYLAIASVLMACVVWTVTGSAVAAIAASIIYVTLPSHVELARYPMSEPLTVVLVLAAVLAVLRLPRHHVALGLLPLALLPHVREEFQLSVLVAIVVLTAVRPRWWSIVVGALVLTSWIQLSGGPGSPTPLTSFGFQPSLPWPSPATVAEGLAKPSQAGHLALPAAMIGLALGLVAPLRASVGSMLARAADAVRARPWVLVLIVALVVVVGDLLKARMEPGETILSGVIRQARFPTSRLLWESAGLLLVLGVVGVAIALPRLIERFGLVGGAWLLPLLAVFVDMHATPTNELWWTRRFHQFAYPALILGATVAGVEAARWVRKRVPRTAAFASVALLATTVLVVGQVALTADRYPSAAGASSIRDDLAATHDALDALPPESVILYGYDGAAQKLQHLSRTLHGHYSFIVWDPSATASVIEEMASTGRPVFVDVFLLERSEVVDEWVPDGLVPSEGGYREIQLERIAATEDARAPAPRP